MEDENYSDIPHKGAYEHFGSYDTPGKPPDKRRHQLEMSHLTGLIQEKEALFKSLAIPKSRKSTSSVLGSRDELLAKLSVLNNENEEKLKQKQVIDAEIKTLNQHLVKKNETCMKLQANVKHKDEQRTNNAIKNLERHLSTHQLKLSEEKKLVSEIDALKRSKKTLSEYLSAKQEVDQLRQRQSVLRSERDTLLRQFHEIKARENDVKVSLDSLKEEHEESSSKGKKPTVDRETLRKEINGLHEQRRVLHENYKKAMASFYAEQKQIEKEKQLMKAEEKRNETRLMKITNERARQDKRPEDRRVAKPYEEERNICVCLIKYLEPLITQFSSGHDELDGNKNAPKHNDVSKGEVGIPEEGSLVTNPKDNLGGLFVPSQRKITRKGSRKGRKSKDFSQKIVLHPHVFEQFLTLSLQPPSTYADVIGILDKLREKTKFYEEKSREADQQNLASLASEQSLKKIVEIPPEKTKAKHEFFGVQREKVELGDEKVNHNDEFVKNEHETDDAQHEIKEPEDDMEQFIDEPEKSKREDERRNYESVSAELETAHVPRDTKQTEHEMEDSQHQPLSSKHEVQREKSRLKNDVYQNPHENEQKELETIKSLQEKEDIISKHGEKVQLDDLNNEKTYCEEDRVATENMLNRAGTNDDNERSYCEDVNKDVLSTSRINCAAIITNALEKGIDSIHLNETSPEIQVRVT